MNHRIIVPEDLPRAAAEFARDQRRSLVRAATASALGAASKRPAGEVLKSVWPEDHSAAILLKAASSPLDTSAYPTITGVTALQRLAPGSIALQVFDRALKVDLTGVTTVRVPFVATPPAASFVGEGMPSPAVQFSTSGVTIGPAKKLLVQSAVTGELNASSPQAASVVVGAVLADAIAKAVDSTAFDASPGSSTRPPGLCYAVSPLIPTTGGGVNAMAGDIANLAAAIAAAGIDPSGMIIVAAVKQAFRLKLLAGPAFDVPVLACASIPDNSVIGIAPQAVAVGYRGNPEISSSREAVIHFADPAAPIASPGTPATVASPVRSAFQEDLVVMKVRAPVAWDKISGGVQVALNVSW